MDDRLGEQVRTLFRWLEEGPPGAIPLVAGGRPAALQAVTWEDAGDRAALARLARWHGATPEAMRRWLCQDVLDPPERILFWVRNGDGTALGHLGLHNFAFSEASAELDNVLRGAAGQPGLMTAATCALCTWAAEALRLRVIRLRVPADSERAQRLARRCGFAEVHEPAALGYRSGVLMQRRLALAAAA
jgi:RimJ/RimL family protein N-acetyltransferase